MIVGGGGSFLLSSFDYSFVLHFFFHLLFSFLGFDSLVFFFSF